MAAVIITTATNSLFAVLKIFIFSPKTGISVYLYIGSVNYVVCV